MKSVRDYLAQDMWGHILMSGDAVRGCVLGETCKTDREKHEYCQGIMTMFPHMMLGNFTQWLWDGNAPKDYQAFMGPSVQALQSKVFPALEQYFLGGLTEQEKGKLLIPLLTDVIPRHVLSGFYDYMFAGQPDYKDISDFWPEVEPLLRLTARELALCYEGEMDLEEKAELFLFIGTRYPFLLVKRWYDWQFGKEKMEGPPGGPPGPPPEG